MEGRRYICSSCKAELSEEDRCGEGVWKDIDGVEWTGKIAGDYEFSGWHVSQLMLWNKTADDIIEAFHDPLKDKQYFYNYVLGLPYLDSEDQISPQEVLRNCVDDVNEQTHKTVIGVDTGLGLHMTLMNKDGVFYYEHDNELSPTRSPYDRLEELMKRFPNSIVVIDQGGELMKTRQLQQKYPGRVFLCYYQKDKKSIELVDWRDRDWETLH